MTTNATVPVAPTPPPHAPPPAITPEPVPALLEPKGGVFEARLSYGGAPDTMCVTFSTPNTTAPSYVPTVVWADARCGPDLGLMTSPAVLGLGLIWTAFLGGANPMRPCQGARAPDLLLLGGLLWWWFFGGVRRFASQKARFEDQRGEMQLVGAADLLHQVPRGAHLQHDRAHRGHPVRPRPPPRALSFFSSCTFFLFFMSCSSVHRDGFMVFPLRFQATLTRSATRRSDLPSPGRSPARRPAPAATCRSWCTATWGWTTPRGARASTSFGPVLPRVSQPHNTPQNAVGCTLYVVPILIEC